MNMQRFFVLGLLWLSLSGCAAAALSVTAIGAAADVIGVVKWWEDRQYAQKQIEALEKLRQEIKEKNLTFEETQP